MSKFRRIQIKDGAITSTHLATGITVNGIKISGSAAQQKNLDITNQITIKADADNQSFDLNVFLLKAGGTVSGTVVVTGLTTANGSLVVPSGASFLLNPNVSGADIIQALSNIDSRVTAHTLRLLTDASELSSEHTHNFDAMGGKVENMLSKTATQSNDTITLNYGTYDAISLPLTSALTSSDIEAFINGQLQEYSASSGYTFDSTSGIVTFNASISGDQLAVIWRSQDATKTGVQIVYTPNYFPELTPNTAEGLYTVGGTTSDVYGTEFSNPANPDGVRDLHLRMTLTNRNSIYRVQLTDGSQIVAASGAGLTGSTYVPLKIFTGGIERSLPFDLSGSGSVTFDLYFTTPSSLSHGGKVYATVFQSGGTTITGVNSSINVGNTALEPLNTASQSSLTTVETIYTPELPRTVFKVTGTAPYYNSTLGRNVRDIIKVDVNFDSTGNSLPGGYNRPTGYFYDWYDPSDPTKRFPAATWQEKSYYKSWASGVSSENWNASDWVKLRVVAKSVATWSKVWDSFSVSITHPSGGYFNTASLRYPLVTFASGDVLKFQVDQFYELKTISDWWNGDTTYLAGYSYLDGAAKSRFTRLKNDGYIDIYFRRYTSAGTGSDLLASGVMVLNFSGYELLEDDPEDPNIDPYAYDYTKRLRNRKRLFSGTWINLNSIHYADPGATTSTSDNISVASQIMSMPNFVASASDVIQFVQAPISVSLQEANPVFISPAQTLTGAVISEIDLAGQHNPDSQSLLMPAFTQPDVV